MFVTSHLAHFYGQAGARRLPPIATSKQAGEEALRGMLDEFEAAGITFVLWCPAT